MEIERANPQQLKLNGKSLTLKNSSEGNQPVPTNTTNAGVQSKDLPSLYGTVSILLSILTNYSLA